MNRNAVVAMLGVVSAFALSVVVVTTAAAATVVPFSFATVPALEPTFSAGTPNYAIACAGHPTTHLTATGSGATVVGGERIPGRVDLGVHLVPGQSLSIAGGGHTYFVRCLPRDFPTYTSSVSGTPQTTGVLVTPSLSFSGPAGHYVIAFDAHGVPVWWYRDPNVPIDAKFLGSSTIGWASGNAAALGGTFVLHRLNGSVEHTVGGGNVVLDEHDVQVLPNGNYLAIIDPQTNVDLSSWGRSAQAQIRDNVIVELNSANHIVWRWSVAGHIDVAAGDVNWRGQYPDVIHMNSIQYVGNHKIVFSLRHLDAVYEIDMVTGAIVWKLGGTPTPQSLTVSGDPYASLDPDALFSGQHDARVLPDGSLTLQDNGSLRARPVRALRFGIDTATQTAAELDELTDARFSSPALCCGGVDKLGTGDWLASWGTANYVTELTPQGVPVLTISYAPYFSYRVAPLAAPIAALRAGMDARVAPLRL